MKPTFWPQSPGGAAGAAFSGLGRLQHAGEFVSGYAVAQADLTPDSLHDQVLYKKGVLLHSPL
jgi:hypothetical protein